MHQAQFEQPIDQQQRRPGAVPPPAEQPAGSNDPPGFRATEVSTASSLPNTVPSAAAGEQTPQEHPLMPALRWAKQGLTEFTKVQDYSCTLVKRERIDGTLGEHEYIFVKVRHQPFSVYTYFLGPARVKGQEAIYVDGSNDGSLLAHGNGIKHRLIGTVSLKPTSTLAMSGNRYPITEMGMRRLLERLLEIGSNDVKYGECTVNWIQGAKVNNRTCTCIQVTHPVPRPQLPVPPGPHLRRRRDAIADSLRGVRLAGPRHEPAAAERGIHLPQREDQQRLHRSGLQHREPKLRVQIVGWPSDERRPIGVAE